MYHASCATSSVSLVSNRDPKPDSTSYIVCHTEPCCAVLCCAGVWGIRVTGPKAASSQPFVGIVDCGARVICVGMVASGDVLHALKQPHKQQHWPRETLHSSPQRHAHFTFRLVSKTLEYRKGSTFQPTPQVCGTLRDCAASA